MKKTPLHISAGAIGSVLLVGLTFVGLVTMFGDNIKALFGMSADGLAGDTMVERPAYPSQGKLEKKKLHHFAAGPSFAYAPPRADHAHRRGRAEHLRHRRRHRFVYLGKAHGAREPRAA